MYVYVPDIQDREIVKMPAFCSSPWLQCCPSLHTSCPSVPDQLPVYEIFAILFYHESEEMLSLLYSSPLLPRLRSYIVLG